jgi:hypothetical protein
MGISSWTGKDVTKELRALAIKCIQDAQNVIALNSGCKLIPIMAYEQGEAPEEFWNLLQSSSEPPDIPTQSIRFTDPILQSLNEPTAPLDLSSSTSCCIKIAVIGGGATGVFCARQMLAPLYKQYLNLSVTLFEKSDSIGGMASKPGDYEAGCPFFSTRSAEFKEFTRKSFEAGHVQPVDMNVGVGEAQDSSFRTFRFAAPSHESAEDQDYVYKKSSNPNFYHPKSTVPFFHPVAFLPPADCFSTIRKDTDPRTEGQKPVPKPKVNQPDFLFHEVHSLGQSMSAGNLWTGRLWRGHPSMADWFTSLLIDSRITINLGTEITNIERLQQRGGGVKVYGCTKDRKEESLLGHFDYIAICTEFNISIKLTKNISKMMHLALAHSFQNDDPEKACNSYHQEVVVEFNPPLATALDMIWLESKSKQDKEDFGLAFALKDGSRQRLFSTGVDRLRGHHDRVVSMAKGYSHSTPLSHPVGGGHSSVAEGEALRDVWVLYSERGWNCLGPIGFHFVDTLNDFKATLQKSVSDQQQVIRRCAFFVKQCKTQILRWQMLVKENDVRTSEYKHKVQQEVDVYDIKLGTLMQMKESAESLKIELQEQAVLLASNFQSAEATKHQLEESIAQMENDISSIGIDVLSLENDLKKSRDAAARCRLDLLAQEDIISAASQQFDRDAIVDAAIQLQYSSNSNIETSSSNPDSRSQRIDWNQNPAVASLVRLDSDANLDQEMSLRNEEIADDDVDYLVHKSANEAHKKLKEEHLRREKEMSMQDELSRLISFSQSAELIVSVQTSKLSVFHNRLASNYSKMDETKHALESLNIDIQNLKMRNQDIMERQNKINQKLEFLCADEVALRVEILQHKQRCHSCMQTLQLETEVLQKKLVEAHKKHDMWILQLDKATSSLDILQQFIDKTSDALLNFDSELKNHSAAAVKQLCKNVIQVCEQSSFANLRDCKADTIVHHFGQRNIGLTSSELRKSKTKLLRYLAEFGAETLLIPIEKSVKAVPLIAKNEPEFVQHSWSQFLDLKTEYADFVLGNLVVDHDENDVAEDVEFVEEVDSKFIQIVGDKVQIDCKSDSFSPLSLLRLAAKLCKACNLNSKQVFLEMLSSDFDQMFAVIRKYFHEYVSIVSHPETSDHDGEEYGNPDDEVLDNFDDEEEFDEDGQSSLDDAGNGADHLFDHDEDKNAGFFHDSDDDSDFMDELSVDRQKRYKLMRKVSTASEIKISVKKREESRETSKLQSAASLCFDGSSLFDFHTKVCVCGNWLVNASIEGAFLSGSGGANRLMQSIEDDPVMLARLGEDALANALYSEELQFRSEMRSNMQKQLTLRRMAQRSNLRPQQSLKNYFLNWQRLTIKGRLLSDLFKRIKHRFFNMCLIHAFSTWAEATDEQWALQFSAILQWTRTLKSRAFNQWTAASKNVVDGSHTKTLRFLFGPIDHCSEDIEDSHSEDFVHDSNDIRNPEKTDFAMVTKTAVPLHTDLSNLTDWCQCPLPPFSWTSEDELCLKLPDISGSTDSDLAKLAQEFLKNKPTKQSEYIFRLGWLLHWYRDNNEFAPKSLSAKMALWEEKHLGLSPEISGQVRSLFYCSSIATSIPKSDNLQVLYFYKMCTLFPLCRKLSWRQDHVKTSWNICTS